MVNRDTGTGRHRSLQVITERHRHKPAQTGTNRHQPTPTDTNRPRFFLYKARKKCFLLLKMTINSKKE